MIIGGLISAALLIMWLTAVSNFVFFPKLQAGKKAKEQPLISILIPARNEGKVIRRTIEAILAQTYKNFELIILNDQSEDNTLPQIQVAAQNDQRVLDHKRPFATQKMARQKLGMSPAEPTCQGGISSFH